MANGQSRNWNTTKYVCFRFAIRVFPPLTLVDSVQSADGLSTRRCSRRQGPDGIWEECVYIASWDTRVSLEVQSPSYVHYTNRMLPNTDSVLAAVQQCLPRPEELDCIITARHYWLGSAQDCDTTRTQNASSHSQWLSRRSRDPVLRQSDRGKAVVLQRKPSSLCAIQLLSDRASEATTNGLSGLRTTETCLRTIPRSSHEREDEEPLWKEV